VFLSHFIGSSPGEVASAAVFVSDFFQNVASSKRSTEQFKEFPEIQQVDLVPTLSMLFGLPIPKNNLGKLIRDVVSFESGLSRWWIEELQTDLIYGLQMTMGYALCR
jgi:ethanolaminephosphotransferase